MIKKRSSNREMSERYDKALRKEGKRGERKGKKGKTYDRISEVGERDDDDEHEGKGTRKKVEKEGEESGEVVEEKEGT